MSHKRVLILERLKLRLLPWKYLWMPKEPASHPALHDTSFIYYMATKTEEKSPLRRHQRILVHSTSINLPFTSHFQDPSSVSETSFKMFLCDHFPAGGYHTYECSLFLFFFFNLCTCAMCCDIKIQRVLSRLFVSQLALTRCPPANKHLQHPVITCSSSLLSAFIQ